jgi:hypothetical protein
MMTGRVGGNGGVMVSNKDGKMIGSLP